MRFPKEGTRAWKVLYVIAIIIRPFFVRLNIEGEENIPAAGGCVIACNHTLGADYVLLGYASLDEPQINDALLRLRQVFPHS